ncbi:MAG TPA: thermonuclease family protein [Methylomirabilota bacterium]|nr:thermonuclease family protein [Methylomirabilota bacterium]
MSKKAAIVVLALAVATGCGSEDDGDKALGNAASARVLRVIDGDTIEVSVDGSEEDVRYIGVDTPETVKPGAPVECYGPQASAANHRLVEGRTVRLVFDRERRDAYGRLLAYVYARAGAKAAADGGEAGKPRFINAALVRGGYARTLEIAPNTAHAPQLRRLEARAGRAGRGLWGGC